MDKSFKSFPIPSSKLGLAKEYRDQISELHNDIEKLKANYLASFEALQEKHKALLRELWFKLAPSAGVDPLPTWGSRDWYIETRYLDDGFGAIAFHPQPNLFSEEEETAPPGTVLN